MSHRSDSSHRSIRISVDAMGGDHAPHEIVKGSVQGAKTHGVGILLVGIPEKIEAELAQHDTRGLDIEIVPAYETIDMGESPVTAMRKKKGASIIVAAQMVSQGKAQGLVAAGSTGAAMAASLFNIGRIEGIDRPAIGVVLPSWGEPCLLLDAGANADCIPEMLLQFAKMGSIFMSEVYQIEKPRVGLLNIGGEAGKGNSFVNAAFTLLEGDQSIHFMGNVEGRDLFLGDAHVVVCDGFTGNVALKSAEGVATLLTRYMKQEMTRSITDKAAALLAKPAFVRAKKLVDHEEFGGALLLGLKGICVIAHGGSSAHAINNAIRVAKEAIDKQVVDKFTRRFLVSDGVIKDSIAQDSDKEESEVHHAS